MHNKVALHKALPPFEEPQYSHNIRFCVCLGSRSQKADVYQNIFLFAFQITALKRTLVHGDLHILITI